MSSSDRLFPWRNPTPTGIVLLFGLLTLFIFCLRSLRSYWRLKHIPGPFLAGFSNLPRVSWVLSKRAHKIHIGLHEKYGDLVRFGPNMVSVSDPAEIPTIYPLKGPGFIKVRYEKSSSSLLIFSVYNNR